MIGSQCGLKMAPAFVPLGVVATTPTKAKRLLSSAVVRLAMMTCEIHLSRSILALRYVDVHMQHCRWCGPSFFGPTHPPYFLCQ